jgi:hypothetical protein
MGTRSGKARRALNFLLPLAAVFGAVLSVLAASTTPAAGASTPIYLNPRYAPAERGADLSRV